MVRTRSGKATTQQEKQEDQKKIQTPKKTRKKAAPKKRSKKTTKPAPFDQLLIDLCFWKPTDKTISLWTCLHGLFILFVTAYSVYDELNMKYPNFYFFELILFIHCFDICANFCNILIGKGHLNDAIFFTESAVNISEVFLFLFMSNNASNLFITACVMFTFNILALNLRYKDDQKIWVRFLVYVVLIGSFAFNYEYIMGNCRIQAYCSLIFASMFFDVFDFPDNFFSTVPMSESVNIFSRSVGIYMLITAHLLSGSLFEFTNIECMVKSWIGM